MDLTIIWIILNHGCTPLTGQGIWVFAKGGNTGNPVTTQYKVNKIKQVTRESLTPSM